MAENIPEEEPVVQQEPLLDRVRRMVYSYPWIKKFLFSVIFPLLPIWIMLLFTLVMSVKFSSREYAATLLTFTITTCAAWTSDLLEETKGKKHLRGIFVEFGLLFVMCLATVFYSVYLIVTNIQGVGLEKADNVKFIFCAIALTFATVAIGLFGNSGGGE